MARLKDEYASRIVPELEQKLGTTNKMLVPRLQKIVINMGFGIVSKDEQKALVDDLTAITGQKPQLCPAKKSISNFKLREGMIIGAKVTLRGERMWEFADRLIDRASAHPRLPRRLEPRLRRPRQLHPRSQGTHDLPGTGRIFGSFRHGRHLRDELD